MKKIQRFNPIIIFVIFLLFITGCKKTDNDILPAKSIHGVSAYDTTSPGKGGITTPPISSALPQRKIFPVTPPQVANPPLGGPPTIYNPYVSNGNIVSAPSITNNVISATLNGTVNANYLPTTVTFEYGRVTAIGTNSISTFNFTLAAVPSILLTGNVNNIVYAIAQPLLTNTTYNFRIKAENSLGIVYSNPVLFTTLGHYIGESYGGGYVFYIDQTGQHGMIAASVDQGSYPYNGTTVITNKTGSAIGTGASNTKVIIAGQGVGSYAASVCEQLVLNGYNDWYLPSQAELYLMYANLKVAGLGYFSSGFYWSSSEYGNNQALAQAFSNGLQGNFDKSSFYIVRAARSF